MDKIKTAVVGLGMGKNHAYSYYKNEKADLRWLIDLDEERTIPLAKELGCGYTKDLAAVLNEVDAVSICTPHHLHALQAIQVMNAGKHVLIEKPMANTEAECLELIEVAKRQGVTLMVAFSLRYMPVFQLLKKALDDGEYGNLVNINCWVEAYVNAPGRWLADKSMLGGGTLFSHGCHYIDVLTWLLGEPVELTALHSKLNTEWMEGEGTSHAIMKFSRGELAHLFCSWGVRVSAAQDRFHIHTTKAVFVLDASMNKLEVITEQGRELLYMQSEPDPDGNVPYEVDHFLDCIRTGANPVTNGSVGLKSLQIIRAIEAAGGVQLRR